MKGDSEQSCESGCLDRARHFQSLSSLLGSLIATHGPHSSPNEPDPARSRLGAITIETVSVVGQYIDNLFAQAESFDALHENMEGLADAEHFHRATVAVASFLRITAKRANLLWP